MDVVIKNTSNLLFWVITEISIISHASTIDNNSYSIP